MDVQESLDFIIKKMATKSDIEEIKGTLAEHTDTLAEHTRQLNDIHTDIKTMREKRLQPEVRVDNVERHLNIKPPAGTMSR